LAPALVGAYQMKIGASDQTLSGTRQLVFNVIALPPTPPPPASPPAEWGAGQWNYVPSPGGLGGGSWTWSWNGGQPSVPAATVPQSDLRVVSADIAFSKNNPAENEEITIAAQIHFWSSDPTSVATDVPINIYATPAGSTSKVWIGKTTIASLSVGSPDYGSRIVYATWRNQGAGIYIVEVDIDPSQTYTDQVTSNNAATRAIVVGTLHTDMGAITGHVTDPFGAVSGAEVDVLDGTGATFASTLTDTTGAYLINQVLAGSYQVRLLPPTGKAPTLNPQTATVTVGAIAEVDFALALGGTGGAEINTTPDGGTGGTGGSGAAGGTTPDGGSAATGGAAGGSSGSLPSTCAVANLTACGSVCVDTNSDANNCGACGTACQTGATCVSGVCTSVCPAGTTSCGNDCVNLQTNPNDCGSCGNVCSSGQTCAAGACTTTCVDGTMPGPTGIPVYIDVSSGIPVVSSPSSWFWSTSPYDLLHLSVSQIADGEWEIDFGFALEFSGCASGNRGVELISPATGDLVLSYGIDSFSYNNYYQEAEVYSRLWVLNSSGQLAGRTPRISNAVVPQMCLVPQAFQLAVPGIINGGVDVYIRAQD
ncbi:MAG: carboxypeptidase regulatory-like domain-containing protein, partial [Polyangia bacterium]